jgi:hypothetical protein
MGRFGTLVHKGKQIVLVDLSNCAPEETLKVLPIAKTGIGRLPPKSALVLTDVTNATYTKEVAAAIKDFSDKNTPYVKASVVVGADGIRQILLQTVSMLTRREIKLCKTRPEALDWLVEHAG